MSKSLKNFTTIDEALKTINPNQLRWMFATHQLKDPLDFSENTILHAKAFDSMIENFFNRIINYPFNISHLKFKEKEDELSEYFYKTRKIILDKFKLFEFADASKSLSELINRTNSYISIDAPNKSLVRRIYDWIASLVTILGFEYNKRADIELSEIMNVLIETRSSIREMTRDKNVPVEFKKKLFDILDKERNISLKNIGISLQDTTKSSSWFIEH